MRRGIIRIIAGAVMVFLQVLVMITQASAESTANKNFWYIIGYYSVGIIGALLLFWGIRVCSNGLCSQLILHSRTKKFHTVIKWIGFAISTVLFLYNLLRLIFNWDTFNFYTVLMILSTLSFSIYSLFYMYKRPSCLFSTTLILIGINYLYDITSNLSYYILYLPSNDHFISYIFLSIIPVTIAGILYIIIATKIYNDRFSVKVIKSLGWTIFALEITNKVICRIVVLESLYFTNWVGVLLILFVAVLMLYTSVFNVNTLRGMVIPDNNATERKFVLEINSEVDTQTPSLPKCEMCDKEDHNLTSAKIVDDMGTRYRNICTEFMIKYNAEAMEKESEKSIESDITTDTEGIKFCRKCGNKLLIGSEFCSHCGTKIIKE